MVSEAKRTGWCFLKGLEMKVRYQKRKSRSDKERLLHILNKRRWRKKTDLRHAHIKRGVVAYFMDGNSLYTVIPTRKDDENLIEEGFEHGIYSGEDYYYYDYPIKSVIGWHYAIYNPYDEWFIEDLI